MFSSITATLKNTYQHMRSAFSSIFNAQSIDQEKINHLEQTLLKADTGVKTTRAIIKTLQEHKQKGNIASGDDIHALLRTTLINLLPPKADMSADVHILIGINGGGKTTTTAKLAHYLKKQGKSVLIAGTDTFRAAASEQLATWAEHENIAAHIGSHGQDPAAVAYQACQRYRDEKYDALIIDTAGRLQTNNNLMQELAKIQRVVAKQLTDKKIATLLLLDSMLGQNGIDQAATFHKQVPITSIIITKMDGTGKAGALFTISQELNLPVALITYGESIENCAPFDQQQFVDQLTSS